MAWFRRKETVGTLPELEQYYNAEKRERASLAWILALISVAGVVLVLIGLVFGGRWLYRRLTVDANKPQPTAVQTEKSDAKTESPEEPASNPAGDNAGSSSDTSSVDNSNTATTPNTSSTPSQNSASSSTGNTGSSNQTASQPARLTNTGPASVVPVFFLATVAGTVLYRFKLKRGSRSLF